ncbi:MAG: glycerophosphodiester phosphodiesterase [Steroidobacteraceae bacterium]
MDKVMVIAHRGASGERPEHTLESYRLAILQGADYIEPDLVMTGDGVLIARHENEIGGTTDVAQHTEFSTRRRTQNIDGKPVTGWFSEDFTLAEIKTLRARERLPALRPLNCRFDGTLAVPTFREILELATETNRSRGGPPIGIYPETKQPAHFAGLGLPLEGALLAELAQHDYAGDDSPVFIQSFDPNNLRMLSSMTRLALVQLCEHEVGDLRQVAEYADAVGIAKALATRVCVEEAHACGLTVHAWTFRAENRFLPDDLQAPGGPEAHGDLAAEISRYLARGIDGFFTDFPSIGVRARDAAATFRRSTPSTSRRRRPASP